MANIFLCEEPRDVETAIMLEKAVRHDIGNAIAYTDGERLFVNTDDNLNKLLPAYDKRMLKWLLWHERYHMDLKHHLRFFKYVSELDEEHTLSEFSVTKEEANIIMDILVHDSLSKMFPELVEVAVANYAQMRNRNSLDYTFTTFTLEEMLDEYKAHKKKDDDSTDERDDGETSEHESDEMPGISGDGKTSSSKPSKGKSKSKSKEESKDDGDKDSGKSSDPIEAGDRKEVGSSEPSGSGDGDSIKETGNPAVDETATTTKPQVLPDEHHKTDWSQLSRISDKEFITKEEANRYMAQITALRNKKLKLAKLTETMNGLASTIRKRTYAMPSTLRCGEGVIMKGRTPGKAKLYLCFDASGSMDNEMDTFKEIISKSIPQAITVPCDWFSGYPEGRCDREHINSLKVDHTNNDGFSDYDYYKGTFKDFFSISASSGYGDDGDRTIELCWAAEQKGYSPIGITDGGGSLSWSIPLLKELKRTVMVGSNPYWLEKVKEVNPAIQTIDI